MAWCLQKTEDDKIYLKLNKKKAIDPSTGSEFGPLVKAEGGRSSDELWFHFEGTNVGRRFLRSKFAVEDLDDSDKFQETLKNQTSNNEFIKELLTYGITNSRKKKPKASQHVNVEVPAISSIAGPTPNACDDFMKTIESKYVGQHSVNVFLLINTPAEYRCREINRSWVDDLKNNIKLAPGGHVTVLPVLIDPKQVSSADAFQKESMLDNNMFLLGGNHLTTACQEILAEEQVNDTFRKYRKVLVDVYVGLERTEALLLGNLHNSRTKTLKMMFQDKVIQARQIFLAKEDDIHVNWKDTATDVFGKIEKKSYSKEGLGTVLSVAEYSEEAFTEVLRIFKNWPEQEVPQKIFRSLQGIESSCLVSYLKMVDSSVSINTVSGLIETEKKKAQLKKIFINITESEDWEEAELLYEQHTSKIDDFLGDDDYLNVANIDDENESVDIVDDEVEDEDEDEALQEADDDDDNEGDDDDDDDDDNDDDDEFYYLDTFNFLSIEDSVSSDDEISPLIPTTKAGKRGRPRGSTSKTTVVEDNRSSEMSTKQKMKNLTAEQLKSVPCCILLCLVGLMISDIITAREDFSTFTKHEKSQFVLDWLRSHSCLETDGKMLYTFIIGTTKVCLGAWLMVLGIPKSTFYAVRNRFLNGEQKLDNCGKKKGSMTFKAVNALSWLESFSRQYAEKLPNTLKMHLPPCLTKGYVHDIYMQECIDQDMEAISKSHFLLMWRTSLSHVAIPKRSRFSKCDKCTLIKIELSKCKDKARRQQLLKKREGHLQQQNAERRKYYKHCSKAKKYQEKYMSIIIDAMDQNKTMLPHFLYVGKYVSGMWKLKVNLVGVIVHGIGIYGFFDIFQWSHGSNLTISVLIHTFMMMESLPPTFYLQMDNCAGQNKNRFVLGFLCLLIELGIFEKVKVSFLMVGHTHEDIDQVFSRFSNYLSKHAVATLEKMLTAFENCYQPSPIGIKTSQVYDFSQNLEIDNISGHSKPHVFKIQKDSSGKAKMFYKKWSTDKEWQETTGNILKNTNIKNLAKIPPDFSSIDTNRLKPDIEKAKKYFKRTEDKDWWDKFLEEIEDNNLEYEDEELDIIQQLLSKKKPIASEQNVQQEDGNELSDEDKPIEPVIIGKKLKKKSGERAKLTIGQMILVDCRLYAGEWPQVGQILSIAENSLEVHWFKGSKTSSWTPCTRQVKGEKGKREPWTDKVSHEEVKSQGFVLTPGKCLPKVIKELIDKYC